MKTLTQTLILIAVLFSSSAFSQIQLSFSEFTNWIQQKAPSGYSATDFNDETGSYSAMLVKGDILVTVSLNDIQQLDDDLRPLKSTSKTVEYERNGIRSLYAEGSVRILYLQLPTINATLILGTGNPNIKKAELEKISDALGVVNIKPVKSVANSWPAEIPLQLRLETDLISIQKMEASTEGYAYEYHVKVKNDQNLIPAINKVTNTCGGDISMTNYKNFTLICGDTDSMEGLRSIKLGETVVFIYYKSEK